MKQYVLSYLVNLRDRESRLRPLAESGRDPTFQLRWRRGGYGTLKIGIFRTLR